MPTLCDCTKKKGKIRCQLDSWKESIKHPSSFGKNEMEGFIRKYERICRKRKAVTESAVPSVNT